MSKLKERPWTESNGSNSFPVFLLPEIISPYISSQTRIQLWKKDDQRFRRKKRTADSLSQSVWQYSLHARSSLSDFWTGKRLFSWEFFGVMGSPRERCLFFLSCTLSLSCNPLFVLYTPSESPFFNVFLYHPRLSFKIWPSSLYKVPRRIPAPSSRIEDSPRTGFTSSDPW